jgi:hypothetical protein
MSTYETNEAKADQQYLNKPVRGYVWALRVSKLSSGRFTLDVEFPASFFFDSDQRAALSNLNLSRLVEVEGICRGRLLGAITFESCKVVSNEKERPR